MQARFYTEAEVASLLDTKTAIEVVEESFRQLAIGGADNVPRRRARASGFALHGMHATAEYLSTAGWKQYSTTRERAKFHVGIYDLASGQLQSILEADRLGQLRTAASAAVAARYLACKPITQMGLFGTGWQAEGHLLAMDAEFDLSQVIVYSRSEERRQSFTERMQDQVKAKLIPVHDPREAVEDLPLIVTITTSKHPVFDGNLVAEGALICAMGCNWPQKREVDNVVIRRCDNWICDCIEACQMESGELIQAQAEGYFDWNSAVTLGDVIAGKAIGRNNADSVVLYKSVGLAVQDVALASEFLKRSREDVSLGTGLPF